MIREADVPDTVTKVEQTGMFPNKQTDRKGSASSIGSSSSASNSAESQAKEKLALYVYEYLLHMGANRAAQTFLSEIQWEKNITLGDPPGFLHSWWCVFWDLYSAAPERAEPHNHTPEAKAFHELNSGTLPSPSYIPQPTDMSTMSGMPPSGYYQHSRPPSLPNSQTSPHQMPQGIMAGPFLSNRYNAHRPPPIRMPNQSMGPVGQSPFSTMDPARHQQASPYQTSSMMNAAAMRNFGSGMPPVPPNYNRIPSMTNDGMMAGGGMGPNGMPMGPRVPWSNPPPSPLTPGPARTPILSSPQGDPSTPFEMEPPDPLLSIPDAPEPIDDMPQESTESAAIQRIKESMKEEVKKFESENNHVPEYYNMH